LPSQSYTLFDIPGPQVPFAHVHPGAEELGRVYSPHLAIHATPTAFAAALDHLELADAPGGEADAAHADYLEWTEQPTEQPGGVNLGAVMVWLRQYLPPDAILCNGAGNYAAWIHRFFRFRRFGQHVAPASGSMGYGVPAAVAMKRLYPDRPVVCLAGDGDFLMNGQEFATAVQYGAPFTIVIVDNGMYGTIRMHQEREYPGRVSATELRNPDFPAYARAFGGFGVSVERTEDFPAAFKEAQGCGKPAIVRLAVDPEAITPVMTLSKIRARALAEKGGCPSLRGIAFLVAVCGVKRRPAAGHQGRRRAQRSSSGHENVSSLRGAVAVARDHGGAGECERLHQGRGGWRHRRSCRPSSCGAGRGDRLCRRSPSGASTRATGAGSGQRLTAGARSRRANVIVGETCHGMPALIDRRRRQARLLRAHMEPKAGAKN
jgi:hypothetical protein